MNIFRRKTQMPVLKTEIILNIYKIYFTWTPGKILADRWFCLCHNKRHKKEIIIPILHDFFLEYAYISKHRHTHIFYCLLYYDLYNKKQHRSVSSREVRGSQRASLWNYPNYFLIHCKEKHDIGWSNHQVKLLSQLISRHMNFLSP